jgi:L-alanine-DL-glutamate epimerase-like enolase superfamily enzyme
MASARFGAMPALISVSTISSSAGPSRAITGVRSLAAVPSHIWVGRRHFPLLLMAGLAASIASTVAWVLGVLDLKAVAGWAATTFIVWWAIMNPADVGHLAANVAVFMSNAKEGVGAFVAST